MAATNMQDHNARMEAISKFLEGRDPMERIVGIETSFNDDFVVVIYRDANDRRMMKKDPFKPFIWAKHSVTQKMFMNIANSVQRKNALKEKMKEYGISVKVLNNGGSKMDRLMNGYNYLFYATKGMSQAKFSAFFNEVGTPIRAKESKNKEISVEKEVRNNEFLQVSAVEQYLISTGRRFFKGYDRYDELHRMVWDIETTGLNQHLHRIDQIGVRTNKGFEEIIPVIGQTDEEKKNQELRQIMRFTEIIRDEKPDIIAGHNSELFDWPFIMTRAEEDGVSYEDISAFIFSQASPNHPIVSHPITKKKRETVLKIGAEIEFYKPTVIWGHTVIDSLHAVRRAQAQDSSMKKANLKYVTKYLKLNKPNRVYVKGEDIGSIYRVKDDSYAFNNANGKYYRITPETPLKDDYEAVSGEYIVERYLKDDLWETDKVEAALNEANFLVTKIVPTSFQRCSTMGTATIWKLITLAWCYENNLAVPAFGKNDKFVGGLARLLRVGYVDDVVKLDYNSLYPSITITWGVSTKLDISNSLLSMLEYVLTQREKYKNLKKKYAKEANKLREKLEENKKNLSEEEIKDMENEIQRLDSLSNMNDKLQLPLKILGNSFFGSYGCPAIFPLGDLSCAEKITCIGRQCLRLMISHFQHLGYRPIVGDSFKGDTPLFIKYKDNELIDIKPISELISPKDINVDVLGREYDYSEKPYYVLCRSGWVEPSYIYRHNTNKPIYNISEGDMSIDVTEDHSLFNDKQEHIKPSQITQDTKLEYYNSSDIFKLHNNLSNIEEYWNEKNYDITTELLNASLDIKARYLSFMEQLSYNQSTPKVYQAKLQYLKNCIQASI